jgi:diguanylate cyclase (GGDEF)-like protein
VTRVRSWALWGLPRAARLLVVTVAAAYLSVAALGCWLVGRSSEPLLSHLGLAAALSAGAVFSAEISMRLAWPRTRRDRTSRDLLAVWMLPTALLLPPVYVAVAVVVPCIYLQLRIWRGQPLKRVYSTAVLGLAYATASFVRHAISHRFSDDARGVTALMAAVAAWWLINAILINAVIALTAGREALRAFVKDRDGFMVDAVGACLGALAAILLATSPRFAVLLLPPVLLLQHQLFSGLRQAVRTDLLTDVANPQYWREVAGRELERAAASGYALSLFMVDVDHFKRVNDKYGHLTGDEVIAAVARTVAQAVRPRDIVGRLGGEEFGVVLSGLNLLEAEGAAERLRAAVSDVRVRAANGDWVSVTVSVGVAELSVTGGDLRQLLDAADMALYAAKAAGRNCVRAAGPRGGQVIDLTARVTS